MTVSLRKRFLTLAEARAAAAPKAAGIAVRARDTGRVLMLQRSITDEQDPARGRWEFPGGKLEPGEAPFAGARREWQEETGVPLPDGERAGMWRSDPYVGHVWVVPSEQDVPLNLGADQRPIGNPDDPDGDDIETLAWLPPTEARAMPGLRPELHGADWTPIHQAVAGAVFKRDSRPVARLRKARYPQLVRAHVRGAATLPSEVQAEVRHYFTRNPDVRAYVAAKMGYDPLADVAAYMAHELAAPEHADLRGPLTVELVRAWEREETEQAQGQVAKEQPTAGDVHIDSASRGGRRRRGDEPDEARELEDAGEPEPLDVHVVKADRAKHLVYGIVLEPHRVDSQGDWEDHEEIEKAAHRFLGQVFEDGARDLVNLQHRWEAPPGVYPVENYIAPTDFVLNGEPVAKGSWVLVVKVGDPVEWQRVLDGEWGGLSVEGSGRRDHTRPAPPR